MAGIGGVACTFVKGNTRGPKLRADVFQFPGISGYGAQLLGYGDATVRFRGIYYGTSAQIETWISAIEALQGTQITIVDDWDVTHPTIRGATAILVTGIGQPQKTVAAGVGSVVGRCAIGVEGVVN